MKKEDLIAYKEKLSKLSNKEKKLRDLYLRKLSTGEYQGPMTGYASIDKPWLKYFPIKGIKTDIPKTTAYGMIYDKRKDNKNYIAFDYLGNKISYGTFFENTTKVAKSLKSLGIKKGDYVTLAVPTCPETAYVLYALNRIGAISNFIDPRLKEKDFVNKMKPINSKTIICIDMCIPEIKKMKNDYSIENTILLSPLESAPKTIKLFGGLKSKKIKENGILNWQDFIKLGNNYNGEIDVEYEPNTVASVVYTGGTTGNPKGVLLTNENYNAMAIAQSESGLDINEKDTFLTFLPPFIAYCIVNSIHDPLYLGCENILLPMFDPKDFPKLMKKYKPNHVLSGPILWDFFINNKKISKEDLSYLKSPVSGGDVLNPELEISINDFFKKHNCNYNVLQGYGMTEVSSAATYTLPNSYKPKSVGVPYFKNNIAIVDPDSNEELKYNEKGEVLISSPTMMKEYLNNIESTNEIITNINGERWIKTGDIGYIDNEGHLFIQGRIKRMIVRNGNKIFPSSIEELIEKTGLVSRCAVVQMEDKDERHVPIGIIVLDENMRGQEQEIMNKINEFIGKNMADFNIPKKYIFTNELPLTNINKIDFKYIESEIDKFKFESEQLIFYDFDKPKTLKKNN